MRMAVVFHKALHKHGTDFVGEMYRELLNREPSRYELVYYDQLLSSGTPKLNVISEIVHKQEALDRYSEPQGARQTRPSIAAKLNELFAMTYEDYVRILFRELLLREADEEGFAGHLALLQTGAARIDLFTGMLHSEEFKSLPKATAYTEYMHIDTEIDILTGRLALAALEAENDRQYLTENSGIVKVPHERWLAAQKAERKHWMVGGLGVKNDRNDEHYAGFDGYRALAGKTFEHAIELGCGPFTNMRLIGNTCGVQSASLLDPMIGMYLTHPNCSYTHDVLRLESGTAPGRTIPIRQLLECPIEQMATGTRYDLVVIINVIEHCYDIEQVFQRISTILKEGGYIVFHDKMYEHWEVVRMSDTLFDAAHPLRVDGKRIRAYLDEGFVPLYSHTESQPMSADSSIDFLYYVGKKK